MSSHTLGKQRGSSNEMVEGTFRVGKNGSFFVTNPDREESIEIPAHKTGTALHRDLVLVTITNKKDNTGAVTEVIKRAKDGFAGIYEKQSDYHVIEPTDPRDPRIIIAGAKSGTAKLGDKVFVRIDHFSDEGPVGHIERVLGRPGDNDVEMMAIALERGFDLSFPPDVEAEARAIADGTMHLPEEERRDMRGTTTFTIDPDDAKDFDDALSFKKLPDGQFEIGIHIADVSHYVRPGSALDNEARERATSVYLVDRTIPMLPEELSNDVCSLVPEHDRNTMSAIFHMNEKGEVTKRWFGRTIIHSDKRFTYREAQEIMDAGTGLYIDELTVLNTIAKKLAHDRHQRGALDLEMPEIDFVLDEEGVPVDVKIKVRQDAHKLIEEFMLLANREIATFMAKTAKKYKSFFVYRIHDRPDPDRTNELVQFIRALGHRVKVKNGFIPPYEIKRILDETPDEYERNAIQTSIIRSMAKAIYSTQNIGHFGLAFDFYTHFTSPIRRYPDIMVHRLLDEALGGSPISKKELPKYERESVHSSERERDAQEAEWASSKRKQVEYMATRIDEIFDGVISGVIKSGIFVMETHSQAEGLISVRSLGDDFYRYDREKRALIGTKTKKRYTLGMPLRIRVKGVDIDRGEIDYEIVEKEPNDETQ